MKQFFVSKLSTMVLVLAAGILGAVLSRVSIASPSETNRNNANLSSDGTPALVLQSSVTPGPTLTPTETIPPNTPLATLTPSSTLRPPPTFEPATQTYTPSPIPTETLAPTTEVNVSIPGLHGAETPTPTSTAGCKPREDWQLIYVVKEGDALANIAKTYNTTMFDLAAANCLTDMNIISVGQKIRVPGVASPLENTLECSMYELLAPINGALTVPATGQLTFNWRGPRSQLNLIRIYSPSGAIDEYLVELRQNETINLADIPEGGTHTWYVFPLDRNYQQVCPNGGPWTFTKEAAN